MQKKKALDCGAGIGRVSKHLLLPLFQSVDLAELNKDFLDRARSYLGAAAARVENYFCCGLQDLNLSGKKYDLIWIQWVTGTFNCVIATLIYRCDLPKCSGVKSSQQISSSPILF